MNEPGLGTGIKSVMDLTPFSSSIGWAGIQTHDILIMSRVRYQLDRTFDHNRFFEYFENAIFNQISDCI